MPDPLERLFLREKPASALLAVGEMEPAYAALVAKRIDSTFPHTCSILSQLESQGLIRSRPEGRIRYLELTERGKRVALALQELSDLLKRPDLQWRMLERMKQIISTENSPDAALRIGPLRRDLARLKGQGDPELRKGAEEIDRQIAALFCK
jgi:DNA-binding MarR family transcriptional regulator